MIGRLEGRLISINLNVALVRPEPGGITYEVLLPTYLAEGLADRVGSVLTLTTFHYLESQGQGTSFYPRLIAFVTVEDRRFFELFTTVKGIGNRKALRAMAVPPAAIARAISQKDAQALSRLPEIGKRLAETIIAELHGKAPAFLDESEVAELKQRSGAGPGASPQARAAAQEAAEALIALGETRDQAQKLVDRAIAGAGTPPTTADDVLKLVYGAR